MTVAMSRPPPRGAKPGCSSAVSTRGPIRLMIGRNAFSRKSSGGANGLCVPPSRVSVDDSEPTSSAGSTVWSTSVVLPADPIETV